MFRKTTGDMDLERAIAEFTGAFEVVFDEDWPYAREILSNHMDQILSENDTFLHPERDPEGVNWGSRAALLQSYERLLEKMRERGIKPHRPVRNTRYVYSWKRKWW